MRGIAKKRRRMPSGVLQQGQDSEDETGTQAAQNTAGLEADPSTRLAVV